MLLVSLFFMFASVGGNPETTTATYDIDVPGSNPIRIVEGEPLWSKNLQQRSFNAYSSQEDLSADSLQQFLNGYAKDTNNNQETHMENVELITKPSEEPMNRHLADQELSFEKPKSWDLLHFQNHHHPYDDKKGWVSMEPVPWSISKISKWQSSQKQKPLDPTYGSDQDFGENFGKPVWATKPLRPYESNTPAVYYPEPKPDVPPVFGRPSAFFGQKVHVNYANKFSNQYKNQEVDPYKDLEQIYANKFKNPHKNQDVNSYANHDENCDHSGEKDIITDGLPSNFPQNFEANRRRGTEIHHDTHPFTGEGDWVLLSTTKGYKYPQQRQRSLQITPDSLGTRRAVRLTVLPPLKNSKVNMTTSHGGLLQVESTFQTVEQAKNQFVKKQKLKQQRIKKIKQTKPVRQVVAPTVTTTRRAGPDTSAVLAAVGAGMIPATMAMLVPMAMGAGRRKRDTKFVTSNPFSSVEITLPRNL